MAHQRQAVLVIHGMGEQRPMATLRAFTDAAIPASSDGAAYHSKPDQLSKSFELRRYLVPATSRRPVTDLYEFYWADKMHGTKLRDLGPLVRALLLRWPWKLRGSIRPFWLLGWAMVGAIVLVFAMTVAQNGPLAMLDSPAKMLKQLPGVSGSEDGNVEASTQRAWVVVALLLAGGFLLRWALSYFGDVARYLDNSPGNVGIRHDIKAAALNILRALHECGDYDRIVVVGHSLGSIIGLDMLANFWAEVNDQHNHPEAVEQSALKGIESLGPTLQLGGPSDQLAEFQHQQQEVWRELRRLGFRWLVTDFVSVGSPLAHADWLMADGRLGLAERFKRREMPSNPPQIEGRGYSYRLDYDTHAGRRSLFAPHHAAMFVCTRWTNIWFPVRGFLFGDPFGGPVAPMFGAGVADRPVTGGSGWIRFFPIGAHTNYWRRPGKESVTPSAGDNIQLLRSALDLESKGRLPERGSTPTEPSPKLHSPNPGDASNLPGQPGMRTGTNDHPP